MARARHFRARHLVLIGVLLGIIVASSVTLVSARRYSEPSIYLLGSGRGLSALVTSETNRILIANGTDPAALATAFRTARPDLIRRIDLVILLPGATERLAERAVEMTSPRRVYALPNERFHPAGRIDGLQIHPMDGPSSITISDDVRLSIVPGITRGWEIEVAIGHVTILLSEHVPARPSSDIDLVVVMGDALDDWLTALRVPLVAAEDAADNNTPRPSKEPFVLLEREEVTRIRVTSSGIVIA